QKLEEVRKEKDAAVQSQEFEKAASLRDTEQRLREELDTTKEKRKEKQGKKDSKVTVEDIASVVSIGTGVPVARLNKDESDRLLNMEEILHGLVNGQKEAVDAVSKAIRRARAGLKDPKRPIVSFIFFGPTGVGKTEVSCALVDALFGEE